MAISSTHPDYDLQADDWRLMRDSFDGERAVERAGKLYLPKPSGFAATPDDGAALYAAYQTRAQFPELLGMTIAGMTGVIHRTEAQVEMPAALEYIWERATPDGLTLEAFHRRITSELLLTGRYGLLVDVKAGDQAPTIAGYVAESLINWSEARDFFVLDETDYVRREFEWVEVEKYRLLQLVDGRYEQRVFLAGDTGGEIIEPRGRAGQRIDAIPFVVAGARDLGVKPGQPPLRGVARSSVNLYQLSADYRWQLFMSGQETLFIFGIPEDQSPSVVGAGVVVTLSGTDGAMPDARYVGPAGTGIDAHRVAIGDERQAAVSAGARLFETGGAGQESGEALRLRYAAQTATLTTIAQNSAAALERALRYAAMMIGASPDEVVVKPNLQFVDSKMTPTDAEALVRVWQSGAMSYQTLYENLQAGEIASAERDHDAEMALIDNEEFRGEPSPAEAGFIPQPDGEPVNQED